jgi:hypothetical protein
MAAQDPFMQDDPERRRKAQAQGPAVQDPSFYEGKTPVLGADVTVQQPAGEVAFPEAASPAAPEAGTGGEQPTGPSYPQFPRFDLRPPEWTWEPPERPDRGAPPEIPQQPQPGTDWWSTGLGAIATGANTYNKLRALGTQPAAGAWPTWAPQDLSLYGGGQDVPWYQDQEFSVTAPETTTAENLGAEGFNLGMDTKLDTTTAPGGGGGVNPAGVASGAAGLGLGAYGLATAKTPEERARAGITTGAGAAGVAQGMGASLGALGQYGIPGIQTALGAYDLATADTERARAGAAINTTLGLASLVNPAIGLVGLPMMLGPQIAKMTQGDKFRAPPGFQYVPGTGNSRGVGGTAIDPATGRMIQYLGNGKYVWHEMTKAGQLPPPDQLRKYGIEPTGALAKMPGYGGIAREIMQADIAQAGQPVSPGGAPGQPTMAHQRSYLEEWRQPYIDQIKAQHPTASEGELWRLYTLTPWYQQELGMSQGWNPVMDRG